MLKLNAYDSKNKLRLAMMLTCLLALPLAGQRALAADNTFSAAEEAPVHPQLPYEIPPTDGSCPFAALPLEMRSHIISYVHSGKPFPCVAVNKDFYNATHDNLHQWVRSFVKDTSMAPLSKSDEEQQKMADFLKNSPAYASFYTGLLLEALERDDTLCEVNTFPWGKENVRLRGFGTLDSLDIIPKKDILRALFPHDTEYTTFNKAVTQDVLHHFKFYIPPHQNITLFEDNEAALLKCLTALKKEGCHVLFSEIDETSEIYKTTPHSLIFTTAELADNVQKERLRTFLEINPEHRVILTVGPESVYAKGAFYLAEEQLPRNLKHLILCDPDHLIRIIGRDSLFELPNLKRLAFAGVRNVTLIEEFCLFSCTNLETVDLSGFHNLKEIEKGFVSFCGKLKAIDLYGLQNLRKTGSSFFDHYPDSPDSVTSIDISPLGEYQQSNIDSLDIVIKHPLFSGRRNLEEIIAYQDQMAFFKAHIDSRTQEHITWRLIPRAAKEQKDYSFTERLKRFFLCL